MINKFLADYRASKSDRVDVDFLPDADAIEQRPLGGVTRWTLYTLACLILAILTWASLAKIDEVVVASGKIVTVRPNLVVQPIETSIIQSIDVRVGQVVRKGQQLAALDPTFVVADETQLREKLASLNARAGRLESELAGGSHPDLHGVGVGRTAEEQLQARIREARDASYRARLMQFDETLEKLRASLVTNQSDQQMLTSRVKLLKEMENMQARLLEQNISARQRYLEAQDKRLEVDRDLTVAQHREIEIRSEIAAEQAEREAFVKEWSQKTMEELVQVRDERDGIADQLQKATKRHTLVRLVTPADAVVLDIAKHSVGSVIREAETLVTLVPLDVPLEAEVQINATDIGFVKVGDLARIKLDAFPFQKHGTLTGTVDVISDDAFAHDPSQGHVPGQSNVYYLARVSLGNVHLEHVGRDFKLIPGLTLQAEIKVGRRVVISFFLYPLIRSLDEGIRER